jgi:hypothetical protein
MTYLYFFLPGRQWQWPNIHLMSPTSSDFPENIQILTVNLTHRYLNIYLNISMTVLFAPGSIFEQTTILFLLITRKTPTGMPLKN